MKIHDRGRKWHIYNETGYGLTIASHQVGTTGYVDGWELATPDHLLVGSDIDSLVDVLASLIVKYDCKSYGKATKDLIVIYTDNIEKVCGFLSEYITDRFNLLYVQLKEYIEIRPISLWKDLTDATEIAKYAQYLIDTLFKPNQYWYLTPNQVPRRHIDKAHKLSSDTTAEVIYPTKYSLYSTFRKALFGGIVYVPYKNAVIKDKLMCLDLTSAYIYDLLIEKHCSTKFEIADSRNWEMYLQSEAMTSIGCYEISYSTPYNRIRSFKTVDGENFEKGEHTVKAIMTSIDLYTLTTLCDIKDITCYWLYSCELDQLPKYLLDEIVRQYTKKVDLDRNTEEYELQKTVVNGIFGDCIRKYNTEDEFNNARRKPSVAPQWGIWCTSYAKKNLLKLASKVQGWVYSDTDSIYCYDNEYNRALLKEYNDEANRKVKAFCDQYRYDYSKLKGLGTFKIEHEIVKFKALNTKTYMYKTVEGEFKLKAAGINQQTIKVDESLFDRPLLDYGTRVQRMVEDGNYWEKTLNGEDAAIHSMFVREYNK